jgi:hypothetical protein
MARERWRFNRDTGKSELVESFGEPIDAKPLFSPNSTFTIRGISVIRDLEPYKSPIDRTVIRSRSEHRDHMKRHGVVELGTEKMHAPIKAQRPRAGHDIKRAIEMVRSGHKAERADFNPAETKVIG